MHEVYENYGIKLTRVNESHLEMIRNWRNSDFVRNNMLFREIITPEMQIKWFHTINNDRNYYYIVQYNREDVGLVNVKDVENKRGEPGFFLASEKYKGTAITALVNFVFGQFMTTVLGIETQYIHIRKDNVEVLKLNKMVGFKIIEERSGEDFYYLELDVLKNEKENKRLHKLNSYIIKNRIL